MTLERALLIGDKRTAPSCCWGARVPFNEARSISIFDIAKIQLVNELRQLGTHAIRDAKYPGACTMRSRVTPVGSSFNAPLR